MRVLSTGAGLRALALCCSTLASACLYTSRPPRSDPVARSPLGVHAEIGVGGDRYAGELLTVTGSDFVVLGDRLVVIPFTVANAGRFSGVSVSTYGAPWPTHAEQLRFASRFPYGIPPEALTAILGARGQAAPDTAKWPGR
jgi:hypothetical protein